MTTEDDEGEERRGEERRRRRGAELTTKERTKMWAKTGQTDRMKTAFSSVIWRFVRITANHGVLCIHAGRFSFQSCQPGLKTESYNKKRHPPEPSRRRDIKIFISWS